MPRDAIQLANYLNELERVVDQMPTIFSNSKNSMQISFNTMVAYRDDPETPVAYVTIIQDKIIAGKTVIQTMLNNIT